MKTTEEIDSIGTAEAAAELKIHPSTLTRWVARNKITPVKRGTGASGEMFFDPADIKRLRETSPVRAA